MERSGNRDVKPGLEVRGNGAGKTLEMERAPRLGKKGLGAERGFGEMHLPRDPLCYYVPLRLHTLS